MTPHIEKKRNVRGTITLVVIVIIVISFIGWIWPAKDDQGEEKNKIQEQTTTQNTKEIKRIEMVPGEWYGPYSIRGGSSWTVTEGEVIVQVDDKTPYQDSPTATFSKSGKKVRFKVAEEHPKATILFKY